MLHPPFGPPHPGHAPASCPPPAGGDPRRRGSGRRVRPLALGLALLAAARAAAAQPVAPAPSGVVRGVVRDSLTGRPLGGASVQLLPQDTPVATPLAADADSSGRYQFAGVAPGRYLLGFDHPRLDSLGMDLPPRVVEVPVGAALDADLAIPSARAIANGVCGARRDTTGVVLGRVWDAERGGPVPAGAVVVRWAELRVDAARGMRRVVERVLAPVGADGRYAACGVPTDVPVLIEATGDSVGPDAAPSAARRAVARSGTVELTFAAGTPLLHRDLYVGTPAAPSAGPPSAGPSDARASAAARPGAARLAGVVRRPDGTPVAGARVVVRDAQAADSGAVADAAGAFRLAGLPGGTYTVEARAIGYAPARAAVDLRAGRTTAHDFALGGRVPTLAPVAVYAAKYRANSEFAHRMRFGFGRFVTAADVARLHPTRLGDVLVRVPGLHVEGYDPSGDPVLSGFAGPDPCPVTYFVDGVRADGLHDANSFVPLRAVGGIEVYADPVLAPFPYALHACAVVLIWSKESVY